MRVTFLGRARLQVESALWSHVCIVIVVGVEDPPTTPTTETPPQLGPPTTTTPCLA